MPVMAAMAVPAMGAMSAMVVILTGRCDHASKQFDFLKPKLVSDDRNYNICQSTYLGIYLV